MIRPEHYSQQSQQPIEYMERSFSQEEYDGFCKGNIIKYVSRFRYKNGLEDLEKAKTYLQFLIDTYEKEENPKCGHDWESIGEGFHVKCRFCGDTKAL